MLKTWSKKGKEKEAPKEKETTEVDIEPSNVQSLIHRDIIQKTLYKDKKEALMERQDRSKTSGSSHHWTCKVCFLFNF